MDIELKSLQLPCVPALSPLPVGKFSIGTFVSCTPWAGRHDKLFGSVKHLAEVVSHLLDKSLMANGKVSHDLVLECILGVRVL